MELRRLCAYNQTRECFLGLEVAAADFSYPDLRDRLGKLVLKSGEGLWMVPFRGIPEAEMRVPLDLIYLDEDCRVIETVESFPTFRVSPSSPPPASVLALPAHSIYSSQTQPGDRLVLCVAEEMQRRLEGISAPVSQASSASAAPGAMHSQVQNMATSPVQSAVQAAVLTPVMSPVKTLVETPMQSTVQSAVVLRERPLWSGGPGVLELGDRSQDDRPKPEQQHEMTLLAPGKQNARPPKSWLERWWSPDPRKAPREPSPGLAAYYWTGSAPTAHKIRDISASGLYVVTEERWYPGTLVLMTLQSTVYGEEAAETAIAVHSRAVRWGDDGVGLQFILKDSSSGRKDKNQMVEAIERKELEQFLQRLQRG